MSHLRSLIYLSNENVLFLFNKLTGVAPYTHEFIPDQNDPHLLASFVSALSTFMEEMLGSEQSHWRTEYGNDATLLVEVGEWIVGCLAVIRETNEARSKLRRVVKEFEESFTLLKNDDFVEGGIFNEFDKYVSRVFLGDSFTENTRVWKMQNWSEKIKEFELPSEAYEVVKFLFELEDGQSIKTISERNNISYKNCVELISKSVWSGAVVLQYIPAMSDILSVTAGSITTMLNTANPLHLSNETMILVSSLDGMHPISEFQDFLDSNQLDKTLSEIGMLVTQGYLQKITLEQSILLMNWCILRMVVKKCLRYVKSQIIKGLFQMIMKVSIIDHPWIGCIHFNSANEISLTTNPHMTPSDFDQMYEDIDFLIQAIDKQIVDGDWLEDSIYQKMRKILIRRHYDLMKIKSTCSKRWMEYMKRF